ncbi:nucleolar complex-associated protein 3, partial [Piedraia hortae CBS 480.64]
SLPGFANWDLEEKYESKRRRGEKKESRRLKVQTEGGWKDDETRVESEEGEDKEEEEVQAEEEGGEGEESREAPQEAIKQRLPPKEEIVQAKEQLARLAGRISEDPEENIAQLGQMMGMLDSTDNVSVQKLVLASLLAVFRDIIPGYRIRPVRKDELAGKVSKEVRRLKGFEQALLNGYKGYVSALDKAARVAETKSVAVGCAAGLLKSVPHFNCRNDVIALLAKQLSGRSLTPQGEKSAEAFEWLFREDIEGHASLEAVAQLTKMMKTKKFHIHEAALNTFLHLRLLSEFAHNASPSGPQKPKKKPREHLTKRERKLLKERKQVEKDFAEADAVVSHEEISKNQSQILKLIFVTYFTILKSKTPHLMGTVLEGLAKFSHLINQDFFADVLETLRELLDTTPSTREMLLCITTAFALLQGQKDTHLDLDTFITKLYSLLPTISMDPKLEESPLPPGKATAKVNFSTTSALLMRCLAAVLLPEGNFRAVPPVRLAAFTKQLLTLSLHLPARSAQAVMVLLGRVTRVHGKTLAPLWCTEERRGDGVFDPRTGKIEAANAFASTAWEGEVLRGHWDHRVREGLREVE